MAATWPTLVGVPRHGTTMGAAAAFVVFDVPVGSICVPVGRKSMSKTSLGFFQNLIPIKGNTNIDRKRHHLFGQRMIVLANHTSPSVDLPTEKKYSHRESIVNSG